MNFNFICQISSYVVDLLQFKSQSVVCLTSTNFNFLRIQPTRECWWKFHKVNWFHTWPKRKKKPAKKNLKLSDDNSPYFLIQRSSRLNVNLLKIIHFSHPRTAYKLRNQRRETLQPALGVIPVRQIYSHVLHDCFTCFTLHRTQGTKEKRLKLREFESHTRKGELVLSENFVCAFIKFIGIL